LAPVASGHSGFAGSGLVFEEAGEHALKGVQAMLDKK
jgi:hypothetical protein